MTKRLKVVTVSGSVVLLIAAAVSFFVVRRARLEFPQPHSFAWRGYPEEKGPTVLLGYDGSYVRVADAIRIDVRRGVPHTRVDETPIVDVTRYVTEELDKHGSEWVVVTASIDEKLGDVLKVIDACRKTRVHGIILNHRTDGWRE